MGECIAEDDLLDLAQARRPLGDAPALEAHLADCPSCSALLCTLVESIRDDGARSDRTGQTIGPYRLDGLIGAGAMGEVYRGWDDRLKRHVAVKLLSRESRDLGRRLEAEGRAAASIAHPNVVTVYDTGMDGGVPYVVSELITGESLRSVIDRGPIPRHTAVDLALQLARGVAAAHAQRVVHRDLKPANLIVTDDGTLKILDFGLAKLDGPRDVEATEPGTLLGTSGYLSPEQARGEPADPRSDIFAIGAIVYELLTGQRAFAGATFAERLSAVLRDTPAIEDPLAPIVLRCLDKDPRKRFQSAGDLAWVLEQQDGRHTDHNHDGHTAHDEDRQGDRRSGGDAPAPTRHVVSRRTFLAGAAATGIAGVILGRVLAPSRRTIAPTYRQLTFRQGRVASARFTRDGGSIVYSAAWEDLPTTVFSARLGGGGTRPLDLPPAQLLAVSSKGELALSLGHRFIEGFHQRGQLAIVPLEGGMPRGLGIDVQHADFTPDGAELAIVRRVGGRFRLELPAGRVLLEAGWLASPRVSPDGNAVACTVHDGPNDDLGDLVVVPRDGGSARTIAAGWTSIDALAWAPDSRALWISASRSGNNNAVRSISLDGRELAQVPSAGRLRLHDVGADGTMAVSQQSGRLRMMAKAPGAQTEADLGLSDLSLVADISADGSTLVFSEFGDVDSANGTYLRPITGGPALRLGAATPLDLADDGRGVLAIRDAEPPGLAVLPVAAGQSLPLPLPGLERVQGARWGARGTIVVAAAAPGRPLRLWRRDPEGTLAPISDEGVVGVGAVSPDGRELAFVLGDRLIVIDVDARRPPRDVPGTFADEAVCGWYAGRDVLVRTAAQPPIQIRRIDVATGASTPVLDIAPPRVGLRGVYAVVVSARADAYAYSYSQEQSRLYAMTPGDLA